jgi:hypothetical protein
MGKPQADLDRDLINAALPYWEAEALVARRFFDAKPGAEAQLRWLRAQVWKELNPVDGYFNGIHRELSNLADAFPGLEKTVDRHAFSFQMRQIVEEFEHYVMFADILEMVSGRKLDPSELTQLPQERKLSELRRSLAESGSEIDRAAVLFTEGGGARLFREGAKLTGGELERKIAHAMQVIYDDERDHFKEGAKHAAELIKSDADLARMKDGIVAVSSQRVAMRTEMFGQPVPQDELDAFIAATRARIARGEVVDAG